MNYRSLLASLLLAASPLFARAAGAALQLTGEPRVGQSFALQLQLRHPFAQLDPAELLLSFGFRLEFDASRLQLLQFLPAEGWNDDSPWLGPGRYGASAFPGVADPGTEVLALGTLRFRVLDAGVTRLRVFSEANDLDLGLNYLIAGPAELAAEHTLALSPVPEPATVVLTVAGLAALGTRRRRTG